MDSAGGEVPSGWSKSQRGNANVFKIRLEMFVAEQNLRQLGVLWEGTPRRAAFPFIFAH
jgi:hypothetical protein